MRKVSQKDILHYCLYGHCMKTSKHYFKHLILKHLKHLPGIVETNSKNEKGEREYMLANSVSDNYDSQDVHAKTQTPHGNIVVKLI